MERFCPKCGRGYQAPEEFCEADGEKLVMVNEEPDLIGRTLEGKYKLTDIVGQGGMGTVYLGYQASMERHVAVKVLKRRFAQEKVAIKRFLREARAASKLSHPNTITVYDFGQTDDGFLYMVMERLTGRALSDILDEEFRLTPARSVHIISQICDSLAQAHNHSIQHRDLKPENIFVEFQVGNPDHVTVLDFGIAKMHEEDVSQATATGMVCGTPAYMSPEQAMGKPIDGRSDIYSLGILLYELLTGKVPFDGDAAMEIMLKQLNEAPPPLSDELKNEIPEKLIDAVHHMLAKAPSDRPQDCQEVKTILLAAIGVTANLELQHSMEVTARSRTNPKKRAASHVYTSFNKSARRARHESTDVLRGIGRKRHVAVAGFGAAVLVAGGIWAAVALQAPDSRGEPKAPRPPASTQAVPERVKSSPATKTPAPDPLLKAAKLASEASAKAEAPDVLVSLTIDSVPTGAKAYDSTDEFLGETQLTVARPQGSGNFTVVLKLDGYHDAVVTMSTVRASQQVRQLESVRAGSDKRQHGPKWKARRPRTAPSKPGQGRIGTF